MSLTPAQAKAMSIVPEITVILLVIASMFMIIDVLRSRKKLGSSYHRIIIGMSICSLSQVFIAAVHWGVSYETGKNETISKPLCIAGRFSLVFYTSVVMYNVTLSVYYFLVVRHNWSKTRIRKIEPWLHIFPIGYGLAISTIVVILAEGEGQFDEGLCFQFIKAGIYAYLIPIWVAMVVVTVMNLLVYRTVRKQERRSERYQFSSHNEERPRQKLSRQAALQGVVYVFPFYITWIPSTICVFYLHHTDPGSHEAFAAALTLTIFAPLQGFFNFFVYFAPRYIKYRKETPESSFLLVIGRTLRRALCFHCTCQDSGASDDESEDGLHSKDGSRSILTSAGNNTVSSWAR
eukprot:CAMPEP_0195539168 /NCGR_PEP_ID=MMETSP0794_2-20130614/49915_1 /TAXON_ID=515487 /ORGANISM="Stephanopyxis turris, Strain CCMP 815" /LENGTH=347 /DNA_ID=CAMNT_0040673189 /DNA_START=110 /DNA_END=1153 /DNA_ORIENTATION=-